MIRTGLGQAEGTDTKAIVRDSIRQCRDQLKGHRPQAGIILGGGDFDFQQMLDTIMEQFPDLDLVGCTTSGEFSSRMGFSEDSLTLLLLASETISIRGGVCRHLSASPNSAVSEGLREAGLNQTDPPSLCLAFPDVSVASANRVIETFNRELGADCPIFGQCPGRRLESGLPVLQFYRNEILVDSAPFLLLGGPLDYAFAVANSWKPVGRQVRVTEAEGRIVHRIGELPALDFYRHYLGEHANPATEFPLAVYDDNEQSFYLRAPIQYRPEDGSVAFTEVVPRGARVQLTEPVRQAIITDTKSSAESLTENCRKASPAFALACSCALRKEALGTRAPEELDILKAHLPAGTPILGFYGHGEIGPLTRGHASFFHTHTLITLLIGEPGDTVSRADFRETPRQAFAGDTGGFPAATPTGGTRDQLEKENEFLRKKLARSEKYRRRLEDLNEQNASLHRKVIQEVDEARLEIQQKKAEIKKSEEKYRRIVETAGEGFVLMTRDLVITDVNDAYCRMLGYGREELIGKATVELASDEYKTFLTTNCDRLLTRDYRRFQLDLVARDNRKIPVLIHGSTLRDDAGRFMGNMAFVTDLTDQKKALQLAAEVQRNLLPQHNPLIYGLDIAGTNIPCEEIGGDYFDYLWGDEFARDSIGVVVGDITGHGVDAALLMTTARAFLRMRASQPGSISQIVNEMNRHLAADVFDSGRFMTMFYLTINPETHRMKWIRAGHDPALLYDPKTGAFDELVGAGPALGVDDAVRYTESQRLGLSKGQIITLGTDGVWEAFNPSGEMFGKERLRQIIRRSAEKTSEQILSTVYNELNDFTRGIKPADDMTLVVIKQTEI